MLCQKKNTEKNMISEPTHNDIVNLDKKNIMNFNDLSSIKSFGFTGFKKNSELFLNHSAIPKVMGVYLVLSTDESLPELVAKGTGGAFKGKDPNVSIDQLKRNWVENTHVIYIGKAGGSTSNATLHSRLKQYLRFGQNSNVGHWGGRYIWQIKDSRNLIICWIPTVEDPREVEIKLIQDFIKEYSKLPFANLTS